jgi:hypothetical protein
MKRTRTCEGRKQDTQQRSAILGRRVLRDTLFRRHMLVFSGFEPLVFLLLRGDFSNGTKLACGSHLLLSHAVPALGCYLLSVFGYSFEGRTLG